MSSEKQTWRVFVVSIPEHTHELTLEDDEHHYVAQVLRLREGDPLEVADGQGTTACATVLKVEKKRTFLQFDQRVTHPEPSTRIRVFVGQPKPGALDELLPLAAELGAHELHVVRMERTPIKSAPKLDRLHRMALESTRITKSPRAMRVRYHETLSSALKEGAGNAAFICDESPIYSGGSNCHNHLSRVLDSRLREGFNSIALFIGPEASFTADERAAITANWQAIPVSLGHNILRVPTAVACAIAVTVGRIA